MNGELQSEINNLYTTFSIYAYRQVMQGCPCCVSDADKEPLHTKPLRQLDGEDLSRYTFKAMTTWGDAADFKHYLPRILELYATTDFAVDTFIIFDKLEYAQWENWTQDEKAAISIFLTAWWADLICNKPDFDTEVFTSISRLAGETGELLERWNISFGDYSFRNFVGLVYGYYNDLLTKRKYFKGLDDVSVEKLINWIKTNTAVLEKGFFHFEEQDRELADKISAALFMVEKTTR